MSIFSSFQSSGNWDDYDHYDGEDYYGPPNKLFYYQKITGSYKLEKLDEKRFLLIYNKYKLEIPKKIIEFKDGELYIHREIFGKIIKKEKDILKVLNEL